MCFVHVIKPGTVLGISGGHLYIRYPDGLEASIPKNTIEGISVFSNAIMTTPCVDYCLYNGIKVSFFSHSGVYRGSLTPTLYEDPSRIRKQIDLSNNEMFCLGLGKKIVKAKLNNQMVVVRRYAKCCPQSMRIIRHKVIEADSLNTLIGYEGYASREYFKSLSEVIERGFNFKSRNRRPASDPFNSMLNLGYSILSREIQGELENRNLYPFIGFIHQDKRGHASLASDLVEEWRSVIVDSVVLSLIQGHEINPTGFVTDESGCYLKEDTMRIFLRKLEKRMEQTNKYLTYVDSPLTFREAIWHQADKLSKAIECSDYNIYDPIEIR